MKSCVALMIVVVVCVLLNEGKNLSKYCQGRLQLYRMSLSVFERPETSVRLPDL